MNRTFVVQCEKYKIICKKKKNLSKFQLEIFPLQGGKLRIQRNVFG